MKSILIIMIVVILVTIFAMLYRVIKGPSSYDRMNGLGIISANTIMLLILFGFIDGRPDMYIDIAISYAILGFIGNITLAKYLERRNQKNDNVRTK